MEYDLIRSKRRTVSIGYTRENRLRVRAPLKMPIAVIERFIKKNRDWILRTGENRKKEADRLSKTFDGGHILISGESVSFSGDPVAEISRRAEAELPALLEKAAAVYGLRYGRVTISKARSYWGTCASDGSIRLNVLLVCLPVRLRSYVIAHELTHLLYMDHGEGFWRELEKCIPNARACRKELKAYNVLMNLLPSRRL